MTKPNHPNKLPVEIDYGRIAKLLARAQYALGRLDGLHNQLKEPNLILAPLTTKEATVSSKIEGTQSSVRDVFLHEAGEKTRFTDVVEVSNYKEAMQYAIEELEARPLVLNLIKEIHEILLRGVRGKGRKGVFRDDQVWLGQEGDPIEKATYVPPEQNLVDEYMTNLEKYIHFENEDVLIQAALIHYQFEAIHPFNDGNGRIGRLLIPLFLYYKNKITLPILYLSGYFESNKDAYLDALHKVDIDNDYNNWIQYFLNAVIKQSGETQKLIEKILNLNEETAKKVEDIKSPYISRIVEFLFKKPIFNVPMLTEEISAHRSTMIRLVEELIRLNILIEIKLEKHKRTFVFTDLVKIL
ncbi:Fic family protein [Candidatus Microgenomates bacterium]|nr:Fic family protein [Candidatus Microgenomates bacterium]